jgi:1,4-dihydroxy-6-naphthoate synthase
MRRCTLGYSPCPNDTFMFYGLSCGAVRVDGLAFDVRLADVETLNGLALSAARLDVTKLSCAAFAHASLDYHLLRSGAALGRGCGPLVVARSTRSLESLEGKRVAMPGRLTTASLLFALYGPRVEPVQMAFHEVMPAVAGGLAEAGVIIHEGRFTYPAHGLAEVCDLGRLWEEDTGLPLPLGAIAARRELGPEAAGRIEAAIRESIAYARTHEAEAIAHARRFAQEMAEDVLRSHIGLYVNDLSADIGREGEKALLALLARGAERGVLPPLALPPFLSSHA